MESGSLMLVLAVIAAIQTPVSGLVLWVLSDLRARVARLEQLAMGRE